MSPKGGRLKINSRTTHPVIVKVHETILFR